MKKTRQQISSAGAVAACAYFGFGAGLAHATPPNPDCLGVSDPNSFFGVANNTYITANNDSAGAGRCINWQSNGSFTVTNSGPAGGPYTFPNIMQGQSYGEGPTANSGLPIQVSAIKRWPIAWSISGTGASGGFNPMIEFWATTYNPNDSTACNNAAYGNCSNHRVAQADGTELMIWLGSTQGSPAGLWPLLPEVTIGGMDWYVYVTGQWSNPNVGPQQWNYIAYYPAPVAVVGMLTSVSMDFKPFFDDAKTRSAGSTRVGTPVACQNGTQGDGQCIYDNWWVTSVQAGFEITGGDDGLTSNLFASALNAPIASCSTPHSGDSCTMAVGLAGVCVGALCVLPAGASCSSDTDCVPGGCYNNVCLGTADLAGQVTCGNQAWGEEVTCSTQQGCTYPTGSFQTLTCGAKGNMSARGAVTCDGPNDCPAGSECCAGIGTLATSCQVQQQPGVVGSGCAAMDPNPMGPQASVVCDPKSPITTCPTGMTCGAPDPFATCESPAPLLFWQQNTNYSVDWAASGSYLGQCPPGQALTGLSQAADGSHAESLLCQVGPAPIYSKIASSCRALMFSVGTNPPDNNPSPWPYGANYPDWNIGDYKAQCAPNEFVWGVSQTPSGNVDSIVCCTGSVTASSCDDQVFYGGNSSAYAGIDWDYGYDKGQCPAGEYVQGISAVVPGTGLVGYAPHALRCCRP